MELLSEEAQKLHSPAMPKVAAEKLELSKGYPGLPLTLREVGWQLVCDPWLFQAKNVKEADLPVRPTNP